MVPYISRTIFVLDTSVLLSAPTSLDSFGNNDVVIPIIVLTELEAKRHHAELGWAARTVLRGLEEVREQNGGLTEPYPINSEGGTVRVELNHDSDHLLPEAMREGNDSRILLVALNLQDEGNSVVLVTQDLPLRLRAGVVGVAAEEFVHQVDTDLDWRGILELQVAGDTIEELYRSSVVSFDALQDVPRKYGSDS